MTAKRKNESAQPVFAELMTSFQRREKLLYSSLVLNLINTTNLPWLNEIPPSYIIDSILPSIWVTFSCLLIIISSQLRAALKKRLNQTKKRTYPQWFWFNSISITDGFLIQCDDISNVKAAWLRRQHKTQRLTFSFFIYTISFRLRVRKCYVNGTYMSNLLWSCVPIPYTAHHIKSTNR